MPEGIDILTARQKLEARGVTPDRLELSTEATDNSGRRLPYTDVLFGMKVVRGHENRVGGTPKHGRLQIVAREWEPVIEVKRNPMPPAFTSHSKRGAWLSA